MYEANKNSVFIVDDENSRVLWQVLTLEPWLEKYQVSRIIYL